jgi:hypothetical protein
MAQHKPTSLNADDISAMLQMAKDAVHYFAGHRHEANCSFFNEAGVDWQLSLSEVPATLASQPEIKCCKDTDAIFFMRMKEQLDDGKEKLGARVFIAPIVVTKTGVKEFPFILNTWEAMPPHWMSPSPSAASSSHIDKNTENLISYFEKCLDRSSMGDMPGLEEEQATRDEKDEMNTVALALAEGALEEDSD